MRESEVGNMKHTDLTDYEVAEGHEHRKVVQEKLESSSFMIREVPMHRMYLEAYSASDASNHLTEFSKGKNFSAEKNVMDHDMPEMVVFIHEQDQQFVEDNCIDRESELDPNRVSCLLDHDNKSNCETSQETIETVSSTNSNGSKCASDSEYHCHEENAFKQYAFWKMTMEGEIDLDLVDLNLTDHQTKKMTSMIPGEGFKKGLNFSRSLNPWQVGSFLTEVGSSSMEFPNSQQFPDPMAMSRNRKKNLQKQTGSDYHEEFPSSPITSSLSALSATTPLTKTHNAIHQSSDSASSAHSFSFPILQPEWDGSPVKMAAADMRESRKHSWRSIFLSCCKF